MSPINTKMSPVNTTRPIFFIFQALAGPTAEGGLTGGAGLVAAGGPYSSFLNPQSSILNPYRTLVPEAL